MSNGLWILLAAVVVALVFGTYRALTDGRFRGTRRVHSSSAPAPAPVEATVEASVGDLVGAAVAGLDLGDRATLVQFSSAFCAPCRAARRTLSEVAELVPGVVHVEVDAEAHLDLVRAVGILRTPTTLVLDAAGREVTRASGAPRKEQVLAALGQV